MLFAIVGGSMLLVVTTLVVFLSMQNTEGGSGIFQSNEPAVFANPETEAFFAKPGWFTLEPVERFGVLRPRPTDGRTWEIQQSTKRFSAAIEEKLGEDWFEDFPEAFMSRIGGHADSKHTRNDKFQPVVHPEKAPIVGIRFSAFRPFDYILPSKLLPVYHRDDQEVLVMARPGYAVAGMNVVSNELCVLRIQFIFMRIVDGRFDRRDQYTSRWIGSKKSKGVPVRLAGDGRAVYGICVSEVNYMIGVRLICDAR